MKRLPWLALLPLILCSCSSFSFQVTPVDNPLPPTLGDIVDVSRVTTVPVAVYQAAPRYPAELREHHIQGSAIIVFTVAPDGSTFDLSVHKATDVRFGQAARDAIMNWRFTPGLIDGRAVYTRMTVPVSFTLGEN